MSNTLMVLSCRIELRVDIFDKYMNFLSDSLRKAMTTGSFCWSYDVG